MAAKSKKTFRYWLQQIHLWTGLVLLLPLLLMGITGAVLVYAHDIEHLLGQGEPQAVTSGEWRSPAEIVAAAQAANTEAGRIPIAVRWPAGIGDPAAVRLSRPGMAGERPQLRGGQQQGNTQGAVPAVSPFAGSLQILVDPVSLQVLDSQQTMGGWVRFFHDLHGRLLIGGGLGRELVGWLGIAMLVLGTTGMIIWWPRSGQWKNAFSFRWKTKGVRFHRDLHGAVGIWSLAIFLLVNFTGVYIAFPQQAGAVINAVWPGRDMRAAMFQARVERPQPGQTAIALDDAVALALSHAPDARFLNAFLPSRPDQALRIGLVRGGAEDGAPGITVLIDPWRHSVIDVFDPQTFSTGETIIAWQRALHYGTGLGGTYRFLVFLSGVIIPIFAVTGTLMWWLKRRNRRATELARQAVLREAAAGSRAAE
ncbi:PepSY domain-containing protein [Ferrovibrio sp.]|uniref:PepSY-associated TM helix domain-containing protein n=1 Tax=Ferrovibrio sp. TaxID=1917215 RepID=UPI000CBCC98C|nr:PepSY-associated TM helix domain-containing protein [Ferrovibrio sp.]PJI43911.1 MAG: hypothetical protein CTR53_02615 [Ferrovibrio sp.]